MKVLVVGAGFTGATVARLLAEKGHKITVVDKRKHIGGNAYDEYTSEGILIHKYGPHVFFTDNEKVWSFVSKFGEWIEYKSVVTTCIEDMHLTMPFNFQAFEKLLGDEKAKLLIKKIKGKYGDRQNIYILEMLNSDEEIIRQAAKVLYDKDYKPYNIKQWGLKPEDIDYSVTERIPIRLSYDSNLKDNKYQYMPKESFSKIFEQMLKHENIEINLNTSINNLKDMQGYDAVLFTGMVDKLLEYKYGKLPYITIKFEEKIVQEAHSLPSIAVYYPDLSLKYTRKTDYSYLHNNIGKKNSVVIEETPCKYNYNEELPFYVVLTEDSKEKYNKYLEDIKKENGLFVAGRLADYKYYNMDNAIARGFEVAQEIDNYLKTKEDE